MASFKKDPKLKYTDMCIYIDANMQYVVNKGEYPEVENNIYEYLYHLLYALALKKGFFPHFPDYDSFALYGAAELYISMRNKHINAGKELRGKTVVPVKSCLNFIKSVLFPLKVNYQRQNYNSILNPEVGQDTSKLDTNIKESIQESYRNELIDDYVSCVQELPKLIKEVINKTPYKKDKVMTKKLYLSVSLTLLDFITIPNALRKKVNKKTDSIKRQEKLENIYKLHENKVILWHLDDDYSDYVELLTRLVRKRFDETFNELRHWNDLSDDLLADVMATAYSTYDNRDIGD